MSDRMLSDEILLGIIKKNGGTGGTTDYDQLNNRPQIGGVTLTGDMSASDLGLASEEEVEGKQDALTAGLYIEINNDAISVKRDISKTAQQIEYNFTIPGDYTLRVKKYVQGDLVDTTDYQFNSVVDPINLDSIIEVSKKPGGGFYWVVKNLIASTTQAADYSVELYVFQTSANYTQTFVTTIDADKKLIIQSELDAAINAIKDGQSINSFADVEAALGEKADTDIVASDFSTATSYTVGDYCIYEGKFYKFKANHSGAWAAADVDEIKIAGELTALKSGLTNLLKYKTFNEVATDTANHIYSTSISCDQYVCLGGCTPYNPNFMIQLSNIEKTTTGYIRYKLYDVANNQIVSDNAAYAVELVFVDKSMLSELVITP